ncbi:hypothetical protein [Pleurocapsa sp. CCALA 161]|nr:hypothetical protein [Pleurocapsa sp. CCALA 161]
MTGAKRANPSGNPLGRSPLQVVLQDCFKTTESVQLKTAVIRKMFDYVE